MFCTNYVIKKGDTLYNISRQFHVGVDAIMAANPLINVYNLMVDQVLCIPINAPKMQYLHYTTYLVEDGDTLGNVLDKSKITLGDLLEFTNLNEIYLLPGSTLQVPISEEGENGTTL